MTLAGEGYRPEGAFTPSGVLPAGVLRRLLSAAVLASDAGLVEKDGDWRCRATRPRGRCWSRRPRPASITSGLRQEPPRIGEIPFSSESK